MSTPNPQTPISDSFAPYAALAADLLPHAVPQNAQGQDGSHDLSHLIRVFRNAMQILAGEGGDGEVLAAAVILHDCISVEKNHPDRARASQLAADKASILLSARGMDGKRVASIAHAIAAHSFSAGIPPETLEARILQDADRLDAIGMIGVARCFYTAGRIGSALYDPADPQAQSRPLDDRRNAIDHFPAKLLTLADGFTTPTGQALARKRHQRLERFLAEFIDEI
ncbi:HD domain-containing protein [Rhizobium halophytocola]|uniref:HD domain-containing protein n=1 Tax=Rhizobium halophytocola TaxID=735519 RepID=A0ABS4DYQ1_9HYPH|nr:HD domain-containing protein [Rhizobium halophytocola]MBP1850823.1 uncharacterized protein [Rhizobium halophytocola]